MDSIRQALIAEAATGKVRSNRLYNILIDLVDALALQTQTPVEVQYVAPPVVNPEAVLPEADLEVPVPVPAETPEVSPLKMFGRSA